MPECPLYRVPVSLEPGIFYPGDALFIFAENMAQAVGYAIQFYQYRDYLEVGLPVTVLVQPGDIFRK